MPPETADRTPTASELVAPRPGRGAMTAYILAALVIVVDQISKVWILERLGLVAGGPSTEVVWPLRLSMVWNQGVSFGLLSGQADVARWLLVAFSVLISLALIWWARRTKSLWSALAFGLIIGGALGNAIDRARFGAVVDFIDVSRLGFFPWVFNVADSAITVGVILLLIEGFFPPRRRTGTPA